jgi:hypothetical protein
MLATSDTKKSTKDTDSYFRIRSLRAPFLYPLNFAKEDKMKKKFTAILAVLLSLALLAPMGAFAEGAAAMKL